MTGTNFSTPQDAYNLNNLFVIQVTIEKVYRYYNIDFRYLFVLSIFIIKKKNILSLEVYTNFYENMIMEKIINLKHLIE